MATVSKKAADFPERKKNAMYSKFDEWQNKLAGLLVIILLCVQPLYFTGERYVRLTWHKFIFFVIYMAVFILAIIIIWAVRMTRNPRLAPRGALTLTDWAVLGFAVVTLLSALLSPYKDIINVWIGIPEPEGRYDGAVTQLLYVAVYFIVAKWYKPRVRHFTLFGISAILVALIGIFQFYGMDFLKLWPRDSYMYYVENYYNILFRSTLGNTNIVSTYVCIAVLLSGYLFIRYSPQAGDRKKRKIPAGIRQPIWLAASALNFWLMELADADSGRVGILVAMLLGIPFIIENRKVLGRALILLSTWIAVYTLQLLLYEVQVRASRTAGSLAMFAIVFIALLAAGIILARTAKQPDPNASAKWKVGVILIAVCIIGGVTGIEVLGGREAKTQNPGGLIYEMREVLHGNIPDEFGTNRVYIWRHALSVYPQHPIIGTGPDTFEQAFPEEAQLYYDQTYDKAHNEYIQILICQGLLGLLCYLVFIVGTLLKPIPKAFKNPYVMAVLAAFIGYIAQAFFNISLPIASQLLWVFAGMLSNRTFRETTPAALE